MRPATGQRPTGTLRSRAESPLTVLCFSLPGHPALEGVQALAHPQSTQGCGTLPDCVKPELVGPDVWSAFIASRYIMPVSIRQLVKLLEEDGWIQVRQKGSHRQFRHTAKAGTVTVAGKPSADVPIGTLNSVLKQAGLKPSPRRGSEEEKQ